MAFVKTALVALFILLLPFTASAGEGILNILYTGAIRGELEPCGCSPDTQSGGLARLSGYIQAEKRALAPYLLVDAGDTFAPETPQGRLKNEAIRRSFRVAGFDAVAYELAGKARARRVKKGGVAVNVSTGERLTRKGAVNVLLSVKPVGELKALKGWDVIISSSGEVLDAPVSSGKTVIVSGYPKGQWLGVLTLRLDGRGRVIGSSHRWQTLKSDVPEDPRVRGVLKGYDLEVAALLIEEDLKPRADGLYLGQDGCVECHQPFVESWKQTRHAGAFSTLERVGKSKDPECVVCHTVGFGDEGGFLSIKATAGLAGVQCESCHGPGRDHARDFGPMSPVGEGVCRKCHTPDNSPFFDYEKYHERIKH